MITARPSSVTQCPPSVAAGSRSKMRGGSTSRAMASHSSGVTVMNWLPSLSWTLGLSRSGTCSAVMGATGDSDCGRGVSITCVQPPRTKPSASVSALAVAGRGRTRDFFQAPFCHSVFDAVGKPRAGPDAGGFAAGLPNLGEIRAALGGLGVPLHARVRGAELLDLHRGMTEPTVDGHQSGGQVPFAVAQRGFAHRGGAVRIGHEIWCLGKTPSTNLRILIAMVVLFVIVMCAVEPQHRPGQLVDVWGFPARGHHET